MDFSHSPRALELIDSVGAFLRDRVSPAEAAARERLMASTDWSVPPEVEALKISLGAGGTGKGIANATRGTAGALKELERRQKSRATRVQRDALDRALVDLAGYYRDVLACRFGARVAPSHPDVSGEVRRLADVLSPEDVLVRLDAVLACRRALEANVKPRVAVEAMMVALRLPVNT